MPEDHRGWRQGDCHVGTFEFLLKAWDERDGARKVVSEEVPGVMVVTQTCDVVPTLGPGPT